MSKWEVTYQELREGRLIIEAKNEEELAELMEINDYDLEWRTVEFYTDVDLLEVGDDYE